MASLYDVVLTDGIHFHQNSEQHNELGILVILITTPRVQPLSVQVLSHAYVEVAVIGSNPSYKVHYISCYWTDYNIEYTYGCTSKDIQHTLHTM